MSDFCYSFPVFKHVLAQAETMDRMVEAIGVDPRVAARVESGMAWYEARTRCLECRAAAECREWLANAPADGSPAAPDFCPNSPFFRGCKQRAV